MTIEVLDPSHEGGAAPFARATALTTLAGTTVGIISNGKEGTKPFFDAFTQALVDEHKVANVVRLLKSNYSAPAEPEIVQQLAQFDAVVTGIGD